MYYRGETTRSSCPQSNIQRKPTGGVKERMKKQMVAINAWVEMMRNAECRRNDQM
jgi:hypothetical protein